LQTLHQELQDISKERTEEASAAHARQLQNDRKIADMSVTISRLQASVRDAKRAPFDDSRDSAYSVGEDEKTVEIRTLSEQILRQQETIGQSKSEISALKSRLKGALSRAVNAEGALSTFQNSDDLYDKMESAPSSGGVNNDGRRTMKRRGGRGNSYDGGSIRSAIRLKQGESGEKIGKAIDIVDSFSVQTGWC
jgi:chromosome segregation ATPase